MSAFFVGQRVRIIYSHGWPELAGEEGRIVGRPDNRGVDGTSEWWVAPDCWGSKIAPRAGDNGANAFAPNGSQLEPIVPEGMQPAKWEDCLWQPEGVAA